MVRSESSGTAVTGPLASSVPPPGSPVDTETVAGLRTGHVKSSIRAWRLVRASVVLGVTDSSMNRAVLGVSTVRSTWISAKPAVSASMSGNRACLAGAAPGEDG